jgi:hypothetical protein
VRVGDFSIVLANPKKGLDLYGLTSIRFRRGRERERRGREGEREEGERRREQREREKRERGGRRSIQ